MGWREGTASAPKQPVSREADGEGLALCDGVWEVGGTQHSLGSGTQIYLLANSCTHVCTGSHLPV